MQVIIVVTDAALVILTDAVITDVDGGRRCGVVPAFYV
jgi:hypothetical protein